MNPLEKLVDLWCWVFGHSEYIDYTDNLVRCRHCKKETIFEPYEGGPYNRHPKYPPGKDSKD